MNTTTSDRVIPFPVSDTTSLIPLPPALANAARKGQITTMTVESDHLEHLGIFCGDRLIIKREFSDQDFTHRTLVVYQLPNVGEYFLGADGMDDLGPGDIKGIVIGLYQRPNAKGTFTRPL